MKRFKLVIATVAMMAAIMAVSAAPALAAPEDRLERLEDRFFFGCGFFFYEFCDFDNDFIFFDDFGDGVGQSVEQEAESGDVDQSFEVSGAGDNSNQTVGLQGVTNTGNAQSTLGITQIGSDADDFEFEDVGADIDVSPELSVESDQKVNQSATASNRR